MSWVIVAVSMRRQNRLFGPVRYVVLVVLCWCIGLTSVHAQAGESPLTLAEYWRRAEQTLDLVELISDLPVEEQRLALQFEADRWQYTMGVTLSDGSQLDLNHSYLVSTLRAEPANLAVIRQMMAGMLAARDSWPAGKHHPDDLAALQTILDRPAYQWRQDEPSAIESWFIDLIRKLTRIFPNPDLRGDGITISIPVDLVVTIAGILILIFVFWFVGREFMGGLLLEAGAGPSTRDAGEPLTAARALQQAQNLSTAGDYRNAVRYLYLASLLRLDERGLLRYDRSRTNREYLRSVDETPELASNLKDVIDVFDEVWYGYQPLDKSSYEHFADRVSDLQNQQ